MTIDSFDVSPRRLWLSSVWRPTELAEWRVDTRCTVGVPIVGGDVVAASDAAWAIFSARRREGTS